MWRKWRPNNQIKQIFLIL